MINSKFFLFSLSLAGFATAAYGLARRNRQLEKRRLGEALGTWEGEGGNLAPSGSPAMEDPRTVT